MHYYYKPLVLAVLTAWAASAQAEVAPFTLGEINVIAIKESSARLSNDTITQEDMRLFNRETLDSALNLLPGVSLTGAQQNGAGAQRNEMMANIRGFNLRQVPIYIDGIPVYVSYDGYIDLARFTTYDLSKIQVSKGFSSVLYGANTLGGAINLVSRKPVKEFEGSVTAGLKTDRDFGHNGYTTDASFGGNQDTWYWQANASFIDINRYRMSADFNPNRFEDGGVRDNSYSRDGKINLKFGITPREGDEYSINYINQQASKGSPPYAGNTDQPINRWDWPRWDKESVYFISNTKLGNDSYIKFRGFHDSFKNELESFTNAARTIYQNGFPSYYSDHSYGGSTEFGTKLSENNTLKLSAHVKWDVHRSNPIRNPKERSEDRTISLGIEDTHAFSDKLSLVTGVSYDKRKNLDALSYITPSQPYQFPHGSDQAWNPQAGLFYHPTEDSEIHFTVARKSRFATLKDRLSTGLDNFGIQNPNLKSESSTNYEIGASAMATPQLRLQGAVFYYNTKDMIQQVGGLTGCINGTACFQQQNIGQVISTGVEFGANYQASEALELGVTYSYIDRDNKTQYKLLGVPRNKLMAYGRWQATSQLALSGNLEASDGAANSRIRTGQGAGNTPYWSTSDGYALLNLKGTYQFNQDWVADLGVNNLLDKNYAYMEGFFLQGRNMFVNVTRKF